MFGVTDRPLTAVITPSNESTVKDGDVLSCSVGDSVTAADNYTWIDSSTGNVVHHGTEWTVKTCSHQSYVHISCVNYADGLLRLECHVTVGMATARVAVMLFLEQSETTSNAGIKTKS